MKKSKIYLWVSLVFFLMVFYSPVSISNAEPEKVEQGLVLDIITRHGSDIIKAFRNAFLATPEAAANNIDNIIFWSTPAAEWVSKAQTGQFDGAWGGGPSTFDKLNNLNLLPEIADVGVLTTAAAINQTISGVPLWRYNATCVSDCTTNPTWISAAISSFGFTLNYDTLASEGISPEEAPKTWNDLADPKYYRSGDPLISIGNPPDTTSNTKIYQIILQGLGWEAGWALLTAIAGNSEIVFGSTDVLTAVQLGEVGVGITIDFYGYSSQINNPQTKYVIPLGQSIVNGDPISLLPGDPAKKDATNAFIEFVLSEEGQKIWLDSKINRLPSRKDVFASTEGQARPDLEAAFINAENSPGIDFDDSRALETENFLLWYFDSTITRNHAALRTEWGKVVSKFNSGDINRSELKDWVYSFGYPLFNETEAKPFDSQLPSVTLEGQWKVDMLAQYQGVGALSANDPPVASRTSPIDYFYKPPPPPPESSDSSGVSMSSTDSITASDTTTTIEPPTEITPGFELIAIVSLIPISIYLRNRRKET